MPTIDRVLILEEEALLALDVESVLADQGPVEVTHYRSVADAKVHLVDLDGFALAVIEARLGAAEVVAFTEQLIEAGVATVVMSADRAALGLFPRATPLGKPFDAAGLAAACAAARLTIRSGAAST